MPQLHRLRRSIDVALLSFSMALRLAVPAEVPAQCCYTEMDLSGVWQSIHEEVQKDGTYVVREFRFTPKDCVLSFSYYGDRERRKPYFTFTAEGSYTVNEPSPELPGAYHAAFRFTRKFLTLRTADAGVIERLGFSGCGLQKDAARDITAGGCSFFRSVEEHPVEYDLVRKDEVMLYFGERPADGDLSTGDRRPAALGPPLRKAEGS